MWEFGDDLRYRWLFSPNLKEVFSFLSVWKDPEDQYFCYASNEIYRGIVIPGEASFTTTTMNTPMANTILLRAMFRLQQSLLRGFLIFT